MDLNANVVLMEVKGEYYLVLSKPDDGKGYGITAFKSVQEGVEFFEDTYKKYMNMGNEWAMSLMIHHTMFAMSIVEYETLDDLCQKLFNRDNLNDMPVTSLSHGNGRIYGTRISDQEIGKSEWERGVKPILLNEKLLEDK